VRTGTSQQGQTELAAESSARQSDPSW
jgi:hypothetical protein